MGPVARQLAATVRESVDGASVTNVVGGWICLDMPPPPVGRDGRATAGPLRSGDAKRCGLWDDGQRSEWMMMMMMMMPSGHEGRQAG